VAFDGAAPLVENLREPGARRVVEPELNDIATVPGAGFSSPGQNASSKPTESQPTYNPFRRASAITRSAGVSRRNP
jgi:hypothetical protein